MYQASTQALVIIHFRIYLAMTLCFWGGLLSPVVCRVSATMLSMSWCKGRARSSHTLAHSITSATSNSPHSTNPALGWDPEGDGEP